MNGLRIAVVVALGPLMVCGFAAYFVWRGLCAGFDIGRTLLDLTDPFR